MSTVRYDSYARGALRRSTEAVSGLHFLLMFVAAGLLVLTRVGHPVAVNLQGVGQQLAEPVLARLASAARPLRNFADNAARYFTVESEFRQLERELASLRQLLDEMSVLSKRNAELARLVNLVRTASVNAVTVEVIAGPKGLFTKSVRIGAGRADGVRYGQPVFSGEGLFGRIIAVGEGTAVVLALNDINSRIPVEVGDDRWPALLVGDNSDLPRLVYLNAQATVANDDVVVTSGASGEFPRGINVGKVASVADGARVRTAARLLAGSYLTVLHYAVPAGTRQSTSDAVPADKRIADSAERGRR